MKREYTKTRDITLRMSFILIFAFASVSLADSQNNLYRDTKYKFRISFPEGWTLKDSDEMNVVKRAIEENSGSSVHISVYKAKSVYTAEMLSPIEAKNFVHVAKKQCSDAVILFSYVTTIGNKKALAMKSFCASKGMTSLLLITIKDKKEFFIHCAAPANLYNKMEKTFMKTITSFSFED